MTDGTPHFCIRPATPDDVEAVLQLRLHATEWLSAAGVEQWTVRETGERNIREHISRGSTYVVQDDTEEVIATLTLNGGDPDFWTSKELRENASYLYKFIIHSKYRGTGLGPALLNWAGARAEAYGFSVLRLDCWRDNAALHSYYERHGFRHLTTRVTPGRMSGALFERAVEYREDSPTQLEDKCPSVISSSKLQDMTRQGTWDDPEGTASVFIEASRIVSKMKREPMPGDQYDYWNTALEQASRALDSHARVIRQENGMYYRVISGTTTRDD